MTFDEITKRAVEVRAKYDELNKRNGVSWNETDLMSGFVGDVGDLSKIIMAKKVYVIWMISTRNWRMNLRTVYGRCAFLPISLILILGRNSQRRWRIWIRELTLG